MRGQHGGHEGRRTTLQMVGSPPRRLVPPSDHNERGHPRLASSTWRSGVSRFTAPDGSVAFRRSLSRRRRCTSRNNSRSASRRPAAATGTGRSSATRLLPPVYVKPFVKRERRGGDRRSRVSTDVRRREDRGTAGVAGAQPGGSGRHFAIAKFGIAAPQGAANVRKLALLASPVLCAAETGFGRQIRRGRGHKRHSFSDRDGTPENS